VFYYPQILAIMALGVFIPYSYLVGGKKKHFEEYESQWEGFIP
jgi:hypothetical protein